jgi:uncharacterized membrane protein (UPF0127 family)
MRFPIDLVLCDRASVVVGVVHRLPPWRVSPLFGSAAAVLELPAGTVEVSGTQVGDTLAIVG